MNAFKNIIRGLFEPSAPALRPQASKPAVPRPAYQPSAEARLAASKALHTLGLMDQAYRLGIWNDPGHRQNWEWDLAVKHEHKNLRSVKLELIDVCNSVICESIIDFGSSGPAVAATGPKGTEVPLIDKKRVARHRVLVTNINADESRYDHLHKLKWHKTETLERAPGSDWTTAHGRKTGGRQEGKLHVASDARQILVITRPIGTKGFGFADCPTLQLSGVYLHLNHMDRAAAVLGTGQKLTGVLVQTLDGIQARSVTPA
jgi:hypothetical protein